MEAVAAGGLVLILAGFLFILVICINAFFVHLAASLLNVARATFGKAILVVVVGGIVSSIVSGIFSLIPVVGIISPLVYLLVIVLFTKAIYDCSLGKAILIQLVAFVITLLLAGGIALLLMLIFGISLAGLTGSQAAIPIIFLAA